MRGGSGRRMEEEEERTVTRERVESPRRERKRGMEEREERKEREEGYHGRQDRNREEERGRGREERSGREEEREERGRGREERSGREERGRREEPEEEMEERQVRRHYHEERIDRSSKSRHRTVSMKWTRRVMGHSLICSLVCSHWSLICSLHTARSLHPHTAPHRSLTLLRSLRSCA